jgi:hypothetical protein
MVLPYLISLVLAAPARAVAHNSFSRLSEYGSAVLLSGLWRPAMEVGSRTGIHTVGAYICSGTKCLIPSLLSVFVVYYYNNNKVYNVLSVCIW